MELQSNQLGMHLQLQGQAVFGDPTMALPVLHFQIQESRPLGETILGTLAVVAGIVVHQMFRPDPLVEVV
jgi:hypothetical protein